MRTSRGLRLSVVVVAELRLLTRRMRRELSISVVWRRISNLKTKIAERHEVAFRLLLSEAVTVPSPLTG